MADEATTDHKEIRQWAEIHRATPAERLPDHVDSDSPVLCFLFPHSSTEGGRVVALPWDEFFRRFDLSGLSFIGDVNTQAVPLGYRFLYAPGVRTVRSLSTA